MRAVVQRVRSASVTVDDTIVGEIGAGLLVLLGVARGDGAEQAARLAAKVVKLRIFEDDEGRFARNVADAGGAVLAVSQFTLHASTKKGNRPSYFKAAQPSISQPLYEDFVDILWNTANLPVKTGIFGADMQVSLVNDGPVTITMDSKNKE